MMHCPSGDLSVPEAVRAVRLTELRATQTHGALRAMAAQIIYKTKKAAPWMRAAFFAEAAGLVAGAF